MMSSQTMGHDKRRSVFGGIGFYGLLLAVLVGTVVLQFFYFHTRISFMETKHSASGTERLAMQRQLSEMGGCQQWVRVD